MDDRQLFAAEYLFVGYCASCILRVALGDRLEVGSLGAWFLFGALGGEVLAVLLIASPALFAGVVTGNAAGLVWDRLRVARGDFGETP